MWQSAVKDSDLIPQHARVKTCTDPRVTILRLAQMWQLTRCTWWMSSSWASLSSLWWLAFIGFFVGPTNGGEFRFEIFNSSTRGYLEIHMIVEFIDFDDANNISWLLMKLYSKPSKLKWCKIFRWTFFYNRHMPQKSNVHFLFNIVLPSNYF